MKFRWLGTACVVLAIAGAGVLAAGQAPARERYYRVPPQCIDRPAPFSLEGIIFNTRPLPNGCAPPVFFNGQYIGQDPDSNIRLYLKRDPQSGYDGPQQ